MAKMNSSYRKFGDKIELTPAKKDEIRTSRDSIRADVKQWLADNGKGSVKFHYQGSFAMGTVISPLDGDDYDMDDGLYLCEYEDEDRSNWPTVDTAHRWVKAALDEKTSFTPVDKNTCIRVPYAHGYHVDMPIYIMDGNEAYLAHKRDGWVHSDAKDFKDWFSDLCRDNDGQLRRLVKYLKRWKDHKSVDLKGIEVTILAAKNFEGASGRDDDALRYTVENIVCSLEEAFACEKPVAPYEDLFDGCSATRRQNIISSLKSLNKALLSAHEAASAAEASAKLRGVFGDDFPFSGDSSSRASLTATAAPAILNRDGRSG